MKIACIIFTLSVFYNSAIGQIVQLNDYKLFDSVIVKEGKDTLSFPWTGGFLQPTFSEINLNQDGLSDLIVFDKTSFHHRAFIRTSPGTNYRIAREYTGQIASSRFFSIFEDFNNDGLEDQFFNDDGIVGVNKNISTNINELVFERVLFEDPNNKNRKSINASYLYKGTSRRLNVGPTEVPAIGDLDGDGDLDFANFVVGSGSVYLYENIGPNNHSSIDSLEFALTNFCFGAFMDNPNDFYVNLGSCAGKFIPSGSRHGGANLTVTDLDCNGLPDLTIGFPLEEKIIALYNNGNTAQAVMTEQDTLFPVRSTAIRSPLFPYVSAVKINGDTLDDLLIAPLDDLNGANHKQVQYYESIPDTSCKINHVPAKDFLSSEHIDIGEQSRFVLIDINGDSLLDILGSSQKLNNGDTTWHAVFYWKNIGTKNQPSFELVSNNFLPLPFNVNIDISIQPIDFNADGAIDLVLTNQDGRLKWLKNTAPPGDSCQFIATPSTLDSLKLGVLPRATFFDFNRDSLPDILAGSYEVDMNYYENIGTKGNPEFKKAITKKKFAGISLPDVFGNGYLQPTVIISDSAGITSDTLNQKTYLYVGTGKGWLYQYTNDSADAFDDFKLQDSLFLYNRNITPFPGDLNGDQKPDLIFGMITGGASLLMKDVGFIIPKPKDKDKDPDIIDTTSIQEKIDAKNKLWRVYPNPANNRITVELTKHKEIATTHLTLQNINGQVVLQIENLKATNQLDISGLSNGVYYLQISNPANNQTVKLVKY